jgi:hypothetical protein
MKPGALSMITGGTHGSNSNDMHLVSMIKM